MTTNKALNKLTYYDTLSDLLPGVIFLWALPTIGPVRSGITKGSVLTGNTVIDLIVFVVLSYILGHVLQFLSKYSMEPLLKKIFWKGQFFSDIFLIGAYRLCAKEELLRYVNFAESELGFQKEDLSVLLDPEVITDESKEKKAMQVCGEIYHLLDAKIQDTSAGQKAHLQSAFYSLFRNLSLSLLVLAVADLVAIPLKYMELTGSTVLLILFNLALAAVFFVLARERGERYVKGLFWSCV
jgi:uncharacterized membrane protein YraQ (UPF0718 family)